MFDFLKKLFGGKKGPSVLGIDIGSSAIKVVQLRKDQGKAVLETYGEIALGPYMDKFVGQAVVVPPEIIVTAIGDLLREAKVTTRNAGLSIPLSSSLISLIEIPTTDPSKLATMVPIEARKYIPVPVSEVLLDWHVIPSHSSADAQTPASAKTEVLLVAIHKDTISKYQSIVTGATLNVSFFEIEAFSSVRAVLDRGIEPILVVDFGASSTKLYVVESGIIRDSHIINQGSQDITVTLSKSNSVSFSEAEKIKRESLKSNETFVTATSSAVQYIMSEIKRVISQYERRYSISIVDIVFTGGGSLLQSLLETASTSLDADIRIADPFSKTETPAFLEPVLKEAGPEFAVAIGVALRKLEEVK